MSSKSGMGQVEWNAYFLGDSFLRIAKYFRELQDEAPDQIAMVADLVGISARKGYDLARIDRTFGDLGVPEGRLLVIGWSKLRVLAGYITSENSEHLLALAEKSSAYELRRLLRDEAVSSGTRHIVLRLNPDQYDAFASAILVHGGTKHGRGLANVEEAIVNILRKLDPA